MAIALIGVWARAFRVVVGTVGLVGGAYLLHRWWTSRAANGAVDPGTFGNGR